MIMFHQCSATFHPVTGVHVSHTVDDLDLGMMYVPADHAVESTLATVTCEIAFELEHEIHGSFHTMFEISAQAPIAQTQAVPPTIEHCVESQHHVIGTITQDSEPRCQARDAIKEIAMDHQVSQTVGAAMQTLVCDLDATKGHAQGYHGSQELVVIAGDVHHPCAAFGMPQHPPYDIAVALAPAQAILLGFPTIQDVAYKIQSVTGMMFEEVVEFFGLAVTRAEMHV